MAHRLEITTPVGRYVQGSMYTANTKSIDGGPLVYKTGDKAGQPRVDYYVAIAIPKEPGKLWYQTDWGMKMIEIAQKGFPGGQSGTPTFAWKLTDGDSLIPNRKGTIPANCDGFKDCWILKFNGSQAPGLVKLDANNKTENILEDGFIKPGDWIQISGHIVDNGSQQQPGIHLNHQYICWRGHGDRIILGVDPDSVGFGGALPAGASLTPVGGFNPPPLAPIQPAHPGMMPPPAQLAQPAPMSTTAPIPIPAPYAPILNTPIPIPAPYAPILNTPLPVRRMTAKARGTYEQYTAMQWTDAQLIANGFMEA